MKATDVIQEGRRRFSVAHLLAAIVVMFVVLPFVDALRYGSLLEAVVFTLLMLAGVSAIGGKRDTYVAAALLAVPTLLTRWTQHFWPGLLPHDLHLYVAVVFVSFVIFHLFRFVISSTEVTAEVLCAAISIYLLFAVAWSFLYTLLAQHDPTAFTLNGSEDVQSSLAHFLALYFSVQVLTTVTFGDVLPVSNVARMLALVEATTGVFYLAIMIARLVGIYSTPPPQR